MSKTLSIREAQEKLAKLPRHAETEPDFDPVAIVDAGRPVAVLLSWEYYESLLVTLDILRDEEMMAAIKQGEVDIAEGRTYSMEEVKRDLGL